MYVSLPLRGLGVVSADSFLKGLLVALCILKLNCKQRLTKE